MLPKFLQPINNVKLIRLGNKFDGGYVVPLDTIKKIKLLVSFGLGNDWSFENDFKNKNPNVKILVFDHTVTRKYWYEQTIISLFYFLKNLKQFDRIFKYFSYLNFFNNKNKVHILKKISNFSNKKTNTVSINNILKSNANKKVFLKIDIENDEYRIINYISKYEKNILGMVIEFHNIDMNMDKIKKFVKKLKLLKICCINGNNIAGFQKNGDPYCIELTFVNLSFIKKTKIKNSTKNLFYPNDPQRINKKLNFN